MMLYLYSIITIILLLANFTTLLNYGVFPYALASVIFLFAVYINCYEINKRSIKTVIFASFLYLLYDISFSFFIGTNIVAFNCIDVLISRIQKYIRNNMTVFHFIFISTCFFLISNIINYISNDIFTMQLLLVQIILSIPCSYIVKSIFHTKKTSIMDYI